MLGNERRWTPEESSERQQPRSRPRLSSGLSSINAKTISARAISIARMMGFDEGRTVSKANRGSWSSALHHRYPKDQTLPVDNAQGSRRSSPAEALQARIPRSREGQASLSFTLLNVTSAHRDSVERITKMLSTGDTSSAPE